MREIVLSTPGRKNALTTQSLETLAADVAAAGREPILLTGAGDAFSAGLDLNEVAQLDLPRARRLLAALDAAARALFEHPAPTVALVNGHALGGGCMLAVCCDHRVMVDHPSARIGLNAVALGLSLPPHCLAIVRARLGQAAAERAVLGATALDPVRAREAGLVDEVASDAPAVARARLDALARHPVEAYAAMKAALRRGLLDLPAEELARFEAELLPRWASHEARAAAARVLGRRNRG